MSGFPISKLKGLEHAARKLDWGVVRLMAARESIATSVEERAGEVTREEAALERCGVERRAAENKLRATKDDLRRAGELVAKMRVNAARDHASLKDRLKRLRVLDEKLQAAESSRRDKFVAEAAAADVGEDDVNTYKERLVEHDASAQRLRRLERQLHVVTQRLDFARGLAPHGDAGAI